MFLKKKIILIFFVVIVIAAITTYLRNNNDSNNNKIGGSFELTNHLGEKTTNNTFNGYHRLVFFGFTHCPDFCPNTLNNIGTIIEKLDKKNKLIPIFITVDPERDTVLKLKNYLLNFNPNIIGLTGNKEQITSVKKTFKIFSKKVMPMEETNKENNVNHNHDHDHGAYAVDHTTIMYLMDEKGKYITHFSSDTKNQYIIKKINQYL